MKIHSHFRKMLPRFILSKPQNSNLLIFISFLGHTLLLWLPEYPPLFDLPNHLARFYLESLAWKGSPLPDGYVIEYRMLPNLGADLVVPVLFQFFSPIVSGKIFLTLSVLLFGIGSILFVSQQHPRPPSSIAAAHLMMPWLFNYFLFMGMLNYYSGVGLALIALWNYFQLLKKRRRTILDIALQTSLVTLLFFWHLTAICIYLVLVTCHIVFTGIYACNWKKFQAFVSQVSPLCFAAVPAVMLCAYLFGLSDENALAGTIEYFSPKLKITNLYRIPFSGYSSFADGIALLFWVSAIAVSFSLNIKAILHWTWLHLACGILFLIYIALPFRVGTTAIVDSRILPVLLICIVGLIGGLPLRMPRLGVWFIAGSLLIRLLSIGVAWNDLSEDMSHYVKVIRKLPANSAVLVNDSGCNVSRRHPGLHAIAWGVIERSLLVSSLFAIPGQQPLTLSYGRHNHDEHVFFEREGHLEIDEKLIPRNFQYFWFYNHWDKKLIVPRHWKHLYQFKDVTLWQIETKK